MSGADGDDMGIMDSLGSLREELLERSSILQSLQDKLLKTADMIDNICLNFEKWDTSMRNVALAELLSKKPLWTSLTPDILTALYTLDKTQFQFKELPSPSSLVLQPPPTTSSEETYFQPSPAPKSPSVLEEGSQVLDDTALLSKGIIKVHSEIKGVASKQIKIDEKTTLKEFLTIILKKFRMIGQSEDDYTVCLFKIDGFENLEIPADEAPLAFIKKLAETNAIADLTIRLCKKKKGGIIRIYNDANPQQSFKSLHIMLDTTCIQLIEQCLKKFQLNGSPLDYDIFEIINSGQKCLKPDEFPLPLYHDWEQKGMAEKVKYVLREKSKTKMDKILTIQPILDSLARIPENSYCADCELEFPSFISVNLGIILCRECALVHNNLNFSSNNFVSKIRPLRFYSWKSYHFEITKKRGNYRSNVFFGTRKNMNSTSRDEYIVDKYIKRKFMTATERKDLQILQEDFYEALNDGNINRVVELIQFGVPISKSLPGRIPPLHEVAIIGNQPLFELLLAHGVSPIQEDKDKRTALFYLHAYKHDILIGKLKEAQIFFEGISHRRQESDVEFMNRLLKTTKGSLTQNKLLNLDKDEFNQLLFDTMQEIESRNWKICGFTNPSSNTLSGAAKKLASLVDLDLRELSDNVFDELNYREFMKIHSRTSGSASNNNPQDDDIWLQYIKSKQLFEKQSAQSYKGYKRANHDRKKYAELQSELVSSSPKSSPSSSRQNLNVEDSTEKLSKPLPEITESQETIVQPSSKSSSIVTKESISPNPTKIKISNYFSQVQSLVENIVEKSKDCLTETTAQQRDSSVTTKKLYNSTLELLKLAEVISMDPIFTNKKDALMTASKFLSISLNHFMERSEMMKLHDKEPLSKNDINQMKLACYEIIKFTKGLVEVISGNQK